MSTSSISSTPFVAQQDLNKDFEVRSLDTMCVNESKAQHPWWYNFKYLAVGIVFGIVFVKAEIISWFRIQEMFRLQSFHMYGVIGTAVVVGMISVFLIKRFKVKTIHGEAIEFHPKKFNKGQIYGGLIFGLGWAMTGACPGPLFAQIGTGALAVSVVVLSAIAGTWIYGYFREKLPH
ncbi:MAG: YeeE/YedE family protein [Chitinophagaceae bacterium]|nr:YeeE/YedE family protein [Chitinophagaceae bacterium]